MKTIETKIVLTDATHCENKVFFRYQSCSYATIFSRNYQPYSDIRRLLTVFDNYSALVELAVKILNYFLYDPGAVFTYLNCLLEKKIGEEKYKS